MTFWPCARLEFAWWRTSSHFYRARAQISIKKNHCGVGNVDFFLTSLRIRSMLSRHQTGRQHRVHKTLRELRDLRRNQIETALFCSSFSSDAMCMW
jgi:hypothetical protein